MAQMFCNTECNVTLQQPGSRTRPSGTLCQELTCTGRESVLISRTDGPHSPDLLVTMTLRKK